MKREAKTALKGMTQEIKSFTTVADERSRALEAILKDLTQQGAKGVEKAVSKYGKYLTPAETALLKTVTDEQINTLNELRVLLKKFSGKPGREFM
jgi:DNA-binding transcriptional regulator YbjK